MTSRPEFWQLLVYCSESSRGSPTGVVFPGDLPAEQFQAIAAALGYPDTVFLTPGSQDSQWNASSFSPAQELSLCTQALIAAFRVLQQKLDGHPARISFRTLSGPINVSELAPEQKDVAWLVGPYRVLDRKISKSPLGIDIASDRSEVLIDTGRTRLFREIGDVTQLAALNLDPSRVMKYCTAEKVDGICLFASTGDHEIRMRVFTTSLDGREDISTGGAVMGLLPYLKLCGSNEPTGPWTIHQGFGPKHLQGTLFTMVLPEAGTVAVGGRHRFVARGTLL